ncbi:hypothetical protein CONPUDRAFT_153272 [Coniophora puteana RWD-64-598 SS2]|uniref:Cytochrome c oxidase subunit 8, mitochondrial n=1 Tax=Coniophora puteana (strain RWD-64-598) TaxID=741705 RepID=A0A5M3MUW3_CONPW|nr:uncharacterized protein CONPUDRAFT_153272 [Coniophora puteana RWD-64-598 SS2]EIW82391.1 hypothetical protein CONPUDRAFT_153272 [Coniophora puteana RWD-64-598 SS2]
MSMLTRTPAVIRSKVAHVRVAPSARFAHDYHHLPFALPGKNRLGFGVKVFAYLITGFSIPFVAAAYQLKKSAA